MRRYRQPPPTETRLGLLGRFLLWIVIGLVMLAVGAVGGAYLHFHEDLAATHPHSRDVKEAQHYLNKVPPPSHAAIALVIGYDHRAGDGGAQSRSDTVMLIRTDPDTKSISMLSFPRDLVVDIYCSPGHNIGRDRINAAYSDCGSKGTLNTVKALTGLPVNYLISVNFRAFKEAVNTLGGVWIQVDRRYYNPHGTGYATINLQPGYQQLTGGSALDFVRYRHTDSDLYRVARQQLFVEAAKEQLKRALPGFGFGEFTTVLKLIHRVTRNIEIAPAVDGNTLLSYIRFLHDLPGGHFLQPKLGGLTGTNELYADPSSVQAAVQDFVSPDVGAAKVADAVARGKKPVGLPPKPAETSVVALNGNGVEASAATAGYLLRQQGYNLLTPPASSTGNAPSFGYFHTGIYYDGHAKKAHAAANGLAKLFAPADVRPMTKLIRPLANGAMVVVVVGKTFHGTIAQAPTVQEPVRQTPLVSVNPAATESLLLDARKKAGFRLELPTAIEESSSPDPEEPLRVYRIAGHQKAVYLAFRKGGLEYWGIEETPWAAAPILGERSFHRRIAGRGYDLYYSGSHLHMVVLRQFGATYWVVNTLVDSMSNETMLAIATGLRPLPRR
jgi:LCP family protein required for cell wall assembly